MPLCFIGKEIESVSITSLAIMDKLEKQQIQEVNVHIKDGIEQWANICLMADADRWAYDLNYDKEDVMNVALLFNHVCSNIGIKTGRIREKEALEFGERIRQLIIDMTGIDPHHVFDEKKSAEHGKEQETTSFGNG